MLVFFHDVALTMTSEFDRLAQAAIELGNQPVVMPIDEIQLAHAFTTLPDSELVVGRLLRELFDHENMHVRRIAVNAARRCKAFETEGLQEALARKLEDSEPWVQYDAAWAIQDAGYDSAEIRQLLGFEAAKCTPADDFLLEKNKGNAELQARVKARKVLEGMSSKMLH